MTIELPHGYNAGDDVTHVERMHCPEECEVPPGMRLVQVVEPGKSFSMRCPNDCGLALRWVGMDS